ncbi:Methyltransferase type 11 [Alloactinosynnema sp. L-07]|uniref:class I SAM-dependent methyltransferase n=1 Tax=Alloactinosynnema sp. L-07 TaxID=1653480 RepID=UPI00065EEF4C|nr:methyltransferase domain-containing protein [Alloactinosynnema sp. L-07]CRK58185.1 Methyltransferase type 11 [Alloactinosynnema sp. L-07]
MDEHKSWLAGVFDRASPTYDRVGGAYHERFARRLVELAGIAPGSRLLDVACGRGAVMLAAAETAGPLTGIDLSPAMIELASAELRAAGVDGFQLLVMDGERLAFPDASFDALTAAFVLFFLPHPDRAAAEFRRVLRPGGRLAVSTWAEDDDRWTWEDELFAAAGTPRRRPLRRPFDRAEDVIELFADAGFADLRSHHDESDIVFASEQQWWDWHWSFSLRGILEQLDERAVATLRAAAFREMAALKTSEGYPMRLNAWFITGAAPR